MGIVPTYFNLELRQMKIQMPSSTEAFGTHAGRASLVNPAKILLVDDDVQVRRALRATLTSAGYVVVEARTGEEALEEVHAEGGVDMVLLDLKMPGIGGLEACRRIRKVLDVPILVISVLRTQDDKVQAFDAGADDYLVKPFGIQELLSRVHALRRRMSGAESIPPFECPGLKIDFERRRVMVDDEPVHLTPTEFELLRYLVLQDGKPVSHNTLLQSLWGPEHANNVERLRVTINQLRRKIEKDPDSIRYIHTEYQFGYRFDPVVQKKAAKRKS